MKYQVVLLKRARNDLINYHRWAAKHAPQTALRWLERFEVELATLSDNPQRCSIAAETARSAVELRQFLFGRSPNIYRVIFTVSESTVKILRIRRAQRQRLSRREIKDALDPW